ncbi:MAG TPA: nitronate monooxygenase [Peptococcaceae bacterium]|nr:nitronate monooxygenase [Peptococcaceae bacterium]
MVHFDCKPLQIGNLTVPIPIVQGGMGVGISLSGLAAAVANEGGLGVISAAGIGMIRKNSEEPGKIDNVRAVKEEIRNARAKTKGVLGINIMVALSDFAELAKAAVEEGIDVIFAGAGLPLNLPEVAGLDGKTKLVPIVSSAKAVKVISKWWKEKYNYIPDAFVVEGPMAGGHLGFKREQIEDPEYQLEKLVPQVLEAVRPLEEESGRKIPVIAAGGIFTGGDMKRFLEMGASAVQMATRFVTTDECDADMEFKQAYLNCKEEDIEIIQSPVGMPGRAIRNVFLEKVSQGEKRPANCPFHCISTCKPDSSPYCISVALINACRGRMKDGFAFIGANGYRIKEIVSVKQLFQDLALEYAEGKL